MTVYSSCLAAGWFSWLLNIKNSAPPQPRPCGPSPAAHVWLCSPCTQPPQPSPVQRFDNKARLRGHELRKTDHRKAAIAYQSFVGVGVCAFTRALFSVSSQKLSCDADAATDSTLVSLDWMRFFFQARGQVELARRGKSPLSSKSVTAAGPRPDGGIREKHFHLTDSAQSGKMTDHLGISAGGLRPSAPGSWRSQTDDSDNNYKQ